MQLLCDSSVSKYCQFKCVDRLLCYYNEKQRNVDDYEQDLHVVPCSRAEIFQTSELS